MDTNLERRKKKEETKRTKKKKEQRKKKTEEMRNKPKMMKLSSTGGNFTYSEPSGQIGRPIYIWMTVSTSAARLVGSTPTYIFG